MFQNGFFSFFFVNYKNLLNQKFQQQKTCLANQLYKVHKKYHQARPVTATPHNNEGQNIQTDKHFFFSHFCGWLYRAYGLYILINNKIY